MTAVQLGPRDGASPSKLEPGAMAAAAPSVGRPVSDEASEQELREVLERLREEVDKKALFKVPPPSEAITDGMTRYQSDAHAFFSHLCKLSLQDIPAGQPSDSKPLQANKLCLSLMRDLLSQCGHILKHCEPFVGVMKEQLCASIIKNSMSSYAPIFVLSLQILVVLIKGFRDTLKAEVGIFIEQIVLRILDSGSSAYEFKHRVLQVLDKLCADAPAAIELFLNFDCDERENNIVERVIDNLSKIAQGRYTASEHTSIIQPNQEQALKMLAFKALVKLMGALVDWSQRMEAAAGTETSNAQDPLQADISTATPRISPESSRRLPEEEEDDDNSEFDNLSTATGTGVSYTSHVMKRKMRKRELQAAVTKFNMKPKKGIEQLRQSGFIGDDASSLAEFFKRTDIGLDKTIVGDYLGDYKPFNMEVMSSLVQSLGFGGLELDAALRSFLSIFRLPGEAQKIERLIEKFADRYVQDNPGKFSTPDCPFVLAFSMIMLQTDLNNPQVKNKMTLDQFVVNNRGIDGGNDLPREYLESIYASVQKNPFSLKEDDEAKARLESRNAKGAAQKEVLFQRETQNIVQRTKELMEQRDAKQSAGLYVFATSIEYVRPFFEVACWPMLATLSVLLETQDEQASVELCMDGFKHCIRIAARFDMDTERDAIVSSLAKFTYLTTLKEMKAKNIDCIKALLHVGLNEGNSLGPSWQPVLHCVSQLDRYQLIKNKAREDFQFFTDEMVSRSNSFTSQSSVSSNSGGAGGNRVVKRRAYGTGISAVVAVGLEEQQVEIGNSESITAQIDAAQIDLLFNRSASLDSAAIVHFVTQLTRVSREELQSIDQPRIFALQKLVEVSDYNMTRPSAVGLRLWQVVSHHFVEAAVHPNMQIGLYSVDSLKQLAAKFLGRPDQHDSQADILGPFDAVLSRTRPGESRELKELVMASVSQMVFGHIHNLKSGWKTVFRILRTASKEHDSEDIAGSVYAIIESVIEKHYSVFAENFSDGVFALSALGQCKANTPASLKSIRYMILAAERLADSEKDGSSDTTPPAGDGGRVEHWLLVLQGMSALVSDPRQDVRTAALSAVYNCLREHGCVVFDEDMWRTVLKGVIRPLFDEVSHQLQRGDRTLAPIVSTQVLRGFKEMPEEHFAKCLPELFPLLCELISVDSAEVRTAVQDIFINQVSPLVSLVPRCLAARASDMSPAGVGRNKSGETSL